MNCLHRTAFHCPEGLTAYAYPTFISTLILLGKLPDTPRKQGCREYETTSMFQVSFQIPVMSDKAIVHPLAFPTSLIPVSGRNRYFSATDEGLLRRAFRVPRPFLQINSYRFRLAPWTFCLFGRMITKHFPTNATTLGVALRRTYAFRKQRDNR
jgi:hypothetical protein